MNSTNLNWLLLALVWITAHTSLSHATPPNVVLIVADDLGWRDLACYGSEFYETPHLDRLAQQGMLFTDAYATCPVCSPSRASLMTGKAPARLGLTAHIGEPQPATWSRATPLKPAPYVEQLPLEEQTLAEVFDDAGYATMLAGKWHLGSERFWPDYQGFDVNFGGWSNGGPFGGKQYFSPYANPRLADGPPGEYLPERLASEVNRFMTAHRYEPFFVYLAPYLVHVPLQAKADLLAKYERKREQLPPHDDDFVTTANIKTRTRQELPVYAAMVEALDAEVGQVLTKLDELELSDNTIVIFTSDNGGLATGDCVMPEDQGWPTTNAPLKAGKGWLYEGGIRVPLIARGPTVAAGARSDRVVTGSDLWATLHELTGLADSSPQPRDSVSFAAALAGPAAPRPAFCWHYPHYGNQGGSPAAAIRRDQWKLIEWYEDQRVELFDLRKDLGEQRNLVHDQPSLVAELRRELDDWRNDVGAKYPQPVDTDTQDISAATQP